MTKVYKPIKTQRATAFEADFEEDTWTFLMPEGYTVAAGDFYIVDGAVYQDLLKAASDVLDKFTYSGEAPTDLTDALNRLNQLVTCEIDCL